MAIRFGGKDAMLKRLGELMTYMSLHTAYPPTESNEVKGGSPPYKRQAIEWGIASEGEISITNQPTFDIPAGTAIASVAYNDSPTSGEILADYEVDKETYTGRGTYTVTSSSIDLNK